MFCKLIKLIAHTAIILGLFILGLMIFFALIEDVPGASGLPQSEQQTFNRIRSKHFHPGSPSILHPREDGTYYFIRDGRVCEFK